MKFKLTQLMAAAAVATSLSGQAMATPITASAADIVYLNGTPLVLDTDSRAKLVYSRGATFDGQDVNKVGGAVAALNVGKIAARDINAVGFEETYQDDPYGEPGDVVRTGIAANFRVDGHTIDDTTGKILSVSSTGGVEHSATRVAGTLSGGVATVTNLRFDLVNNLVYADLTGTKAAVGSTPSVSYNLPNTALWTIGAVTGPTHIDPAALALSGQDRIDALAAGGFIYDGNGSFNAQTVLSNLLITQAGFEFFRNSLGLLSTGQGAFSAVNAYEEGWGSVTLNLSFSVPAVPEPGSYAMAGMGLLVVLGALRARRPRKA